LQKFCHFERVGVAHSSKALTAGGRAGFRTIHVVRSCTKLPNITCARGINAFSIIAGTYP